MHASFGSIASVLACKQCQLQMNSGFVMTVNDLTYIYIYFPNQMVLTYFIPLYIVNLLSNMNYELYTEYY